MTGVDPASLFEVSQTSDFVEETNAFSEGGGVQPYISPAEIARLEGLGRNNPIKKADGTYVFPSDFEAWKLLMVDQINSSLATILLPATSAAEAARDLAVVAQLAAEAAVVAANQEVLKAKDWATGTGEIEAGLKSAKAYAQDAKELTSGARVFQAGWDASGGTLPIPAPVGTDAGKYWQITVGGTLPQVGVVEVEEEIVIRADLTYELLPSSDKVKTINGQKGIITLDKTWVGLDLVENFPATDSLVDGSSNKYSTAAAALALRNLIAAAQAVADGAVVDAAGALGVANTGVADASNALSVANAAGTLAQSGVDDAGVAQATADNAVVAAATADGKAVAADNKAVTAQATADSASSLAATKQTAAQVDASIATHNSSSTHPSMSVSGNDLYITF